MAKINLAIKATAPSGESTTTTVTNINPAMSNTSLSNFAHYFNSMTNNTFTSATKITQVNVDGEDDKETPTLSLDLSSGSVADLQNKSGTINVTYNGDGEVYATTDYGLAGVSYKEFTMSGTTYKRVQVYPFGGNYSNLSQTGTLFTVHATETENYNAANVSFTLT